MTSHSETSSKCCPFWDKYDHRSCKLVEIGLFIPTHDYILQFCENEFSKCHYNVSSRKPGETFSSDKIYNQPRSNRRLFTRIPSSLQLKLSSFSITKDTAEEILDEKSRLVDLSLCGLRIETSAGLNTNQVIFFSGEKQSHSSNFIGKGEVRWIRAAQSHHAQSIAGLAFIDQNTKDTVKNYLVGLGEKIFHKF